jgi:hypothetical protein
MSQKLYLLATLVCSFFSIQLTAQDVFTANTAATSWHNATSWSRATFIDADGIPDADDQVVISSATALIATANAQCKSLIILNAAATINLGGFTLTIIDDINLTRGTISNGSVVANTTLGSIVLGDGLGGPIFNATVNFKAPQLSIRFTTFNGVVSIEKNGLGTDSWGNNNFNAAAEVVCKSGTIQSSNTIGADKFLDDVRLQIDGAGILDMAKNYPTIFSGNLVVESGTTSTGKIQFSTGAAGAASLANFKTITVGPIGFSSGRLELYSFTTNMYQSLTLTGSTTHLQLGGVGKSCFFAGGAFSAPSISSVSSTYSSSVSFIKTGLGNNDCGGNTFQGAFTSTADCPITADFVNNGIIRWGNIVGADEFLNPISLNAANYGGVYLANNYTHNINTDIICNSTAVAPYGVRIGENQKFSGNYTNFSAGKIITSGSFSSGILSIKRFRQFGSNTNQFFTLTGTSEMQLGLAADSLSGNTFEADLSISGTKFVELGYNTLNKSLFVSAESMQFTNNSVNVVSGTTTLNKTGAATDTWLGGNKVAGVLNINLLTGSGSIYQADLPGTSDSLLSDLNINNASMLTPTGAFLYMSNLGSTFIGGNINLQSSGNSSGVTFNFGGTVQAANKNITTSFFNNGTLRFINFKQQVGSTSLLSNLENTANNEYIDFLDCIFYNTLKVKAARLGTSDTKFYGISLDLTKTQTNGDACQSGNYIAGNAIFTNESDAEVRFTANALKADSIIGNLTLVTKGTVGGKWDMSYAGNCYYGGNIEIISTATGGGVTFANTVGSNYSTQQNGKTINTNGFLNGNIIIKRFLQLGNALNGSSVLNNQSIGGFETRIDSSVFYNTVQITSPNVYTAKTNYKNVTQIAKNGAATNSSTGGNVFEQDCTLTSSGTGEIVMASATLGDTYNNLFLRATGTGSNNRIRISERAFNIVNGDISLLSNNTSDGIQIGANDGVTTQAFGKTINTVAASFTSGRLYLRKVLQSGPANSNTSTLLNTATNGLSRVDGCEFNTIFVLQTAGIETLRDNTFFNTTTLNKTGSRLDQSIGGNIFNSTLTVNNSGIFSSATANAGLEFGTSGVDTYNGNSEFNLSSNGFIRLSKTFNSFINGNIVVNNTAGFSVASSGIYIGNNNATSGITTQAANTNLSTGTFNAGLLSINKWYQPYSTQTSTINLTNAATLRLGVTDAGNNIGGIFNATVASAAALDSNRTFNNFLVTAASFSDIRRNHFNVGSVGTTTITKNGTTADANIGSNVFDGATTITNTSTGSFRISQAAADDFNNDVTFVQQGTGVLSPSWNKNSTYAGSIYTSAPAGSAIVFGSGGSGSTLATATGLSILDGNTNATLNLVAGNVPQFNRLQINKTAGRVVTLNTRINVNTLMEFTSGLFNTTNTNILNLASNTATTIGSVISYVNGPMYFERNFAGSIVLNFAIGKANDWRPVELTVKQTVNTNLTYKAEVFKASARDLWWTLPLTVQNVSKVHYWDIERLLTPAVVGGAYIPSNTNIDGNQFVKLYYGYNDVVSQPASLTICKNTPLALTSWIDIGGTGATVDSGWVSSTSLPSAFNSFSRFTLGNKIGGLNVLPISILQFDARTTDNTTVDIQWLLADPKNVKSVVVERSYDGVNYAMVQLFSATNLQALHLVKDNPLAKNNVYYRLRINLTNGTSIYSDVKKVRFNITTQNNFTVTVLQNQLLIKAKTINKQFFITDVKGAILQNGFITNYNTELNIDNLPAGVYFLITEDEGKKQQIKFIKF